MKRLLYVTEAHHFRRPPAPGDTVGRYPPPVGARAGDTHFGHSSRQRSSVSIPSGSSSACSNRREPPIKTGYRHQELFAAVLKMYGFDTLRAKLVERSTCEGAVPLRIQHLTAQSAARRSTSFHRCPMNPYIGRSVFERRF